MINPVKSFLHMALFATKGTVISIGSKQEAAKRDLINGISLHASLNFISLFTQSY